MQQVKQGYHKYGKLFIDLSIENHPFFIPACLNTSEFKGELSFSIDNIYKHPRKYYRDVFSSKYMEMPCFTDEGYSSIIIGNYCVFSVEEDKIVPLLVLGISPYDKLWLLNPEFKTNPKFKQFWNWTKPLISDSYEIFQTKNIERWCFLSIELPKFSTITEATQHYEYLVNSAMVAKFGKIETEEVQEATQEFADLEQEQLEQLESVQEADIFGEFVDGTDEINYIL
jgi:hypothetical protein